jgi:O-antigen/teichoic acid export membrane protein
MTEAKLSTKEVKRRAVTGAVVDAVRAGSIRMIALAGTVVLARLLTPYDIGLVTVGTTVYAFADFLDDGGVGTVLLRREEPPTKAELQAVFAFQLAIDVLIVIAIGLATLPLGVTGRVTTVIACALPLGAFRTVPYILYERRLIYKPMARAEIIGTFVYYIWAVTTVCLGWGVWGLATGYAVRELTSSVIIMVMLPEGRVLPVPSWAKMRPLLRFGVQVQAVGVLHLLRDQGVNIIVAAVGGVSVLGLWGVAWRIIQLPVSLIAVLWRVSTPGMAKLVAAKEDLGSTIERVIALVAVGVGVLIVPLAASASAWIHVLMGAKWADAASAIPTSCFAMAFAVPISVALTGYLWAIGNASAPMRATAIGIPATFLIAAGLEPLIGLTGVGLAYVANAAVESLFFITAGRQTTHFRIGGRLAIPLTVATLAGLVGLLVEHAVGPNVLGALASSVVSLGAFLGGLALVHRSYLTDAWALLIRGLRGAAAPQAVAA